MFVLKHFISLLVSHIGNKLILEAGASVYKKTLISQFNAKNSLPFPTPFSTNRAYLISSGITSSLCNTSKERQRCQMGFSGSRNFTKRDRKISHSVTCGEKLLMESICIVKDDGKGHHVFSPPSYSVLRDMCTGNTTL